MANDPREPDETLPRLEGGGAEPAERDAPTPESTASQQPGYPPRIGRYRVDGVLGKGAFGLVYLAHDDQLQRHVAIKVPHRELTSQPTHAAAYLAEARALARLDHPHIVPVLDVGSTAEFPCFFVSKYIDGTNLGHRIEQSPVTHSEAAEWTATVAEALHYAHKQGVVHRDVKPGNILIDRIGRPYVVDFGLALTDALLDEGSRYAGTPAYMSPEQARGEGHRVDGRSDIYSLGAVLYQLLTGRRTFTADTREQLLTLIATRQPKPPRQIDDRIPKELERICLKALSRRASDRYTTGKDMAEDLWEFLSGSKASQAAESRVTDTEQHTGADSTSPRPESAIAGSDRQPVRIVPKGLRSFDEHDADFFLELLPGPRDREGLPASIRFWKTRIEEPDPEKTFSVGLIYGPSGCGKSSLVRAGLLPRLSRDVIGVYVEATGRETELRLLNGLRKHCPGLPRNLNVKQTMTALRRGQGVPVGKKVLIVLDQFEQWLHSNGQKEGSELVQALRQCDGGQVQCIVMVRDDFWLAVSRFMHELEVRLLEGQNSTLVDLFDVEHARRVVAAFGWAYGRLPEDSSDFDPDQKDFITQSIADLAQDGKVICVRLSLFAEMMKAKPWVPAVLKQVGGARGVGTTFLEETFSASTSPPEHRLHQKAARAVLKELLPESGTSIRGHMRSHGDLLEASGYARRPQDFDELLNILDREVRLITPTDPEGVEAREDSAAPVSTGQKHYQLTHDYLVPSLREWLTRKQKETARGRAELRLLERAALWTVKPENRHLPSWWEFLGIIGLTSPKSWTERQRSMMRNAGRLHAGRAAMLFVLIAVLSCGGFALNARFEARSLVDRLVTADAENVVEIAERLSAYRRWAEPRLQQLVSTKPQTSEERRTQLHARLALVHFDPPAQIPGLQEALLKQEDITYVPVLRRSLEPYRGEIVKNLWQVLHDTSGNDDSRFRAGLALAGYEPESAQWTADDDRFLVDKLVASNPIHQPVLWALLSGVSARVVDPLENAFLDANRPESQQIAAANAIKVLAARDTVRLARLLVKATPGQYQILYPELTKAEHATALAGLPALVKEQPPEELGPQERVVLGKRRANAAITLLRGGERESVFDALRVRDDPESLTQFLHGCRARGVTATELLECLDRADGLRQAAERERRKLEDRVLFAILLALGEFDLREIPASRTQPLIDRLAKWYATDPSSAVHGATGWLLRRWGFAKEVAQVDQTPLPFDESGTREWFVMGINAVTGGQTTTGSTTTRICFTFVVWPPAEFTMGAVEGEEGREASEEQSHQVRITRPIAVSDREITWGQLNVFSTSQRDAYEKKWLRTLGLDEPAAWLEWFDAVRYCRWLTHQAGLSEQDQCYDDETTLVKGDDQRPKSWPMHVDRAGFRLPTEAEWEYVCRSGTKTAYSFGNDRQLLGRYGWFIENSGDVFHGVARLRPNMRGMFDLHGNVFEWCQDCADYYSGNAVDPIGSQRTWGRALRGGSCVRIAANCRSASRCFFAPQTWLNDGGFRVALVPSAKQVSRRAASGAQTDRPGGRQEPILPQPHQRVERPSQLPRSAK